MSFLVLLRKKSYNNDDEFLKLNVLDSIPKPIYIKDMI